MSDSTSKPIEFVDVLFLGYVIVAVFVDTFVLLWALTEKDLNATVLAILSGFIAANTTGPLGAWVGFRYGSSAGSKAKDDAMADIAKKAAE